ncbi:Aldehyde oxidase/xanthine dehydrogenase, molybdopterin binding [Burkholderiaceae bacterium]
MTAPTTTPSLLPGSLQTNRRLSQWLTFLPDGRVQVKSGKVEIGQGILHALVQIAAQELGLPVQAVEAVPASTAFSPNEAVTSGSLSVQDSGTAVRHACRQARALFVACAAEKFGLLASDIQVVDGVFMHGSRSLCGYGDVCGDVSLDREALPEDALIVNLGGLTDTPLRPDLWRKFLGHTDFIQDLEWPGLLHGRMVRPPNLQAALNETAWAQAAQRAQGMPNVQGVYRDGLQIGVLAHTETAATQAADQLIADLAEAKAWTTPAVLPDAEHLQDWLRQSPLQTSTVHAADDGWAKAQAQTVQTLQADYNRGYVQHASMSPSCALAHWQGDALQVWSHSQGIFNLRRDLALALACTPEHVTVQHVQGAGCYGHNGADDVAFDAAWLARFANGQPVRVLWSRHDEMAWSPLGPAMSVRLQAGLDAQNGLSFWQHTVWSQGHGTRPGRQPTPALLGSWLTANHFPVLMAENAAMSVGGGSERNAVPPYTLPAMEVVNHRVMDMPMRVSALRALGAHVNVFAAESFMDEVAFAAGQDPLALRLAYLQDPRARAVLQQAAAESNWAQRDAAKNAATSTDGEWGLGLAFARYKNTGAYCAVVAEVEVAERVHLKRLWVVADVGHVVDADGASNQLEGGAIQSASWTLLETAKFDRQRLLSVDWEQYPILRFDDVPEVSVSLIDTGEHASLGAGEASLGPCAAAIGNAVFHALGVRVRDMPMTPEQIVKAIDAVDRETPPVF